MRDVLTAGVQAMPAAPRSLPTELAGTLARVEPPVSALSVARAGRWGDCGDWSTGQSMRPPLRPGQDAELDRFLDLLGDCHGLPLPLAAPVRRECVLAFERTPVPAGGASVSVSVETQVEFTPERLFLPEAIAASITVDGVSLDGIPLFPGCGHIPGLFFACSATGLGLGSTSLRAGGKIAVTVTNISGQECIFQGALVGKALAPSSPLNHLPWRPRPC